MLITASGPLHILSSVPVPPPHNHEVASGQTSHSLQGLSNTPDIAFTPFNALDPTYHIIDFYKHSSSLDTFTYSFICTLFPLSRIKNP